MLKKISTYTFIGFLGAGVNFFLMPYLSHFISPAEYGLLSMVNSYVTILIPLIGLVASSIISVDYFRIKNKAEFASLFSSLQLIPLVPAIVILIINCLFPSTIASLFEIPENKMYWLNLSVLIAFLIIYTETLLAFTITEQKPGFYALFNISKLLIEVSLTLWFVTGLNMNWEGRLLSWLIVNLVFFFIAFAYFHKRRLLTLKVSKKYILLGISFGLPLILHTLGKFVINQSDRLFIAKMVSIKEAGIYNMGYQVGMVMLILVSSVGNFMSPYINERLSNPTFEGKLQIVKLSYIVTGIYLIFLFFITILTPTLFSWLIDADYGEATQYVFWVALSYFFWGIYLLFTGYIFFTKKTRFLGYMAIFNVFLNAGLNYLLIKNYGAIGAAWATCISFFVIALLTAIEANKRVKLPWKFFIK